MALFKRLFGDLFFQKQSITEEAVIVKETIVRSKFFKEEYRQWVEAGMHHGLVDHLKELNLLRENNPNADVPFFKHISVGSNGFYFLAESPWTNKDYEFFVYFIIERLKGVGYHNHHASREASEKEMRLKIVEKHHLKPALKFRRSTPYTQLFGNILIEHRQEDERTVLVKVMANYYSDRSYDSPKTFEELMSLIFTVK